MQANCKNLKYILPLLLGVLWACRHQNDANSDASTLKDSLSIWMKNANNRQLSAAERKYFLNKAKEKCETITQDTTRAKAWSRISLTAKNLGDTTGFLTTNRRLRNLALKIEDYQSLGEAYWDLGYFHRLKNPDSAYYFYREAYHSFVTGTLDDSAKDYPGRVLYDMALVKSRNKDYVGAEKNIVAAIQFYHTNEIEIRLFDSYNLLATIQIDLKNFEKALYYYEKAKEYVGILSKEATFREMISNKINIASANVKDGNIAKGIYQYEEVLKTDSLAIKRPRSFAQLLGSIADAKFQLGNAYTDSLKADIEKSNHILDSIGNTYYQARNQEFLAEILAFENDTLSAIKAALKGKNIAKATNNNDRLLRTLKLLTDIDQTNSAQYAQAYFKLNDSLLTQERNIRNKFARIELETDEIIEENEALALQKKILMWATIAAVLLALATYIIIRQRANNQKLRFQQGQQENDQKIYDLMLSQQGKLQEGKQLEQKRVSEELHDGILGQMLGIRLILTGLNESHDEAAVAHRAELIEKLRELEEEIRTISHELNDASYQKIHNFILAIDDLVKNIGSSANIESSFEHDKRFEWDSLKGDTKINLYRIVQECLQNCVKHAQCDSVIVHLNAMGNQLKLTITDNGKGFDMNKAKKGIGLKNIISRVAKLSGTLNIDSKLGKGTQVNITAPKYQQQNLELKNAKTLLKV